jgi:hypothetical protein
MSEQPYALLSPEGLDALLKQADEALATDKIKVNVAVELNATSSEASAEEAERLETPAPVQKTLLDYALDCIRRGWHVFPCKPNLKRPAVTHGWKQATLDEAVVRGWWARNPNFNPAISLGPSNLVVYDFDSIKPFDNLPSTFTVKTGRIEKDGISGIQMYYSGSCKTHGHPGGGGEVRSRGAYVMAAGAVHPDGNIYRVIEDLPLAPSPEQNADTSEPAEPPIGTEDQNTLAGKIEEAFDLSGVEYQPRIEHEGGFKWYIACPWRDEHTTGKDFDTSSAVIQWPSGKLIYECKHGHCQGIHQWKELRYRMQHDSGFVFSLGLDEPEVKPEVPAVVTADPKTWRSYFKSITELDQGEVRMLIEEFLPEGTSFIGALPGEGKTLLALSMAKALTTGRPFLGKFAVPAVTSVLYLIPESGGRAFRGRCERFGISQDPERFRCRTISEGPTLPLSDPITLAAVREMRPVVIIDTLIRFSRSMDENAAAQNKQMADDIIALRQAGAVAVVVIHHSTKAMRDAGMTLETVLRGTGDLAAMADGVWGMLRDIRLYDRGKGPNQINIECVKPRDFTPALPFKVEVSRKTARSVIGLAPGIVSVIDLEGDLKIVGTAPVDPNPAHLDEHLSDLDAIGRAMDAIQVVHNRGGRVNKAQLADMIGVSRKTADRILTAGPDRPWSCLTADRNGLFFVPRGVTVLPKSEKERRQEQKDKERAQAREEKEEARREKEEAKTAAE